ncbi:Rv1476 family membrane protein [Mycobacterium sp. BMJ-28]
MTIEFAPAYIPPDVCSTVGLGLTTPVDQCMAQVLADVREDGVSAPASADPAALAQVVADAKGKGIDLKLVVLPTSPPIDTPLRDIADQVGTSYPGSTVLAISPGFAGTYSPVYDRVTLEAGQDLAKTGNAVQSSKNFVTQLSTPDFPWTPFTIALVLGVAVAAVGARLLQVRARRQVAGEIAADSVE